MPRWTTPNATELQLRLVALADLAELLPDRAALCRAVLDAAVDEVSPAAQLEIAAMLERVLRARLEALPQIRAGLPLADLLRTLRLGDQICAAGFPLSENHAPDDVPCAHFPSSATLGA